ncbi:hypothetical protein GCM10017673_11560 [Streptosporangium violaceochromogenes]|nr:hypothetical protein GCM10017673_11560 [Streptosporangium violaceochromogenes]
MIGQPRTPGRHRAGQPSAPTPVYRRIWDGPAREKAEVLERSRPGWVVWYGTGTRHFYAIAAWPTPEPVMVSADTAEDLAERMRHAETQALLQAVPPGPATPDQTRRPPLPCARRSAVRPARTLPYPPEGSTP